jgi:spoIIIJ-associated protein
MPDWMKEGKLDFEGIQAALRSFLDRLLAASGFSLTYQIRSAEPADLTGIENPEVVVEFAGEDSTLLLERNAELLRAMEYICLRGVRFDPHLHDRIRFDCEAYKATRIEELKLTAQVAAEKVRATGQPFRFNPMTARERRVIHLTLKDVPGIRTASEGFGEGRHLVIYPEKAPRSSL